MLIEVYILGLNGKLIIEKIFIIKSLISCFNLLYCENCRLYNLDFEVFIFLRMSNLKSVVCLRKHNNE